MELNLPTPVSHPHSFELPLHTTEHNNPRSNFFFVTDNKINIARGTKYSSLLAAVIDCLFCLTVIGEWVLMLVNILNLICSNNNKN